MALAGMSLTGGGGSCKWIDCIVHLGIQLTGNINMHMLLNICISIMRMTAQSKQVSSAIRTHDVTITAQFELSCNNRCFRLYLVLISFRRPEVSEDQNEDKQVVN